MTAEKRQPRRRWWPLLAATLLLLVAAGVYLGWPRRDPASTASPDATHANLRGVGYMEQFDFARAAEAFEEAARSDPGWVPARINLAVALFNTSDEAKLARARSIFADVLAREPDSPHAHYCLGTIDLYQNRLGDAYAHFDAVARIDPGDAHTWFHMGLTHPKGKESAEAKVCFETALKLDPYLNAARYNVAQHPVGRDPKRSAELLQEHQALMNAEWETLAKVAYSEMGPYADVIGRPKTAMTPAVGPLPMFAAWDAFEVRLAAGTTWLDGVPARFGAAIVLLDFDRDGRPDVLLPSAVVRGGKPADLLLRNDGGGVLTDVTADAGLGGTASLGCAVADYDNDGLPDLLLTGVGPPRLFRNAGKGRFAEANVPALTAIKGKTLGAAWVDLDQDGDLDLIVARSEGGFAVLLNVGEAPPVEPGKEAALSTAFRLWDAPEALKLGGPAVGLAVGDLDGDRDVDLLFLTDGRPAFGAWNDRLLRFRPAGEMGEAATWNGVLLLDANHDGRSDVLTLPVGKPPALWLSRPAEDAQSLASGYAPGATNSPPLLQAQAIDLDRDGWADVVGLSAERRPVLLQNDGAGKLVLRAGEFGPMSDDVIGVAAVDLDGDGHPDLLTLSAGGGLTARRNGGNGNHTLRLELSGKRGNKKTSVHTNADGIGAWVVAQAGPLWTGQERTTLHAGLGQSCLPVELGLGRHARADVVRVRWPDGLPQAELDVAAGATVRIVETNRKSTSCPVLFAWDGERYRFVTDFLGGGALGELGPDGSTRPPRPEESLALTLAPLDGWYRLKITEPMDEVLYLDHLELVVVDHPAAWLVLPDERFVMAGPPPTQELLFLADARPPVAARDGGGKDVLPLLRERDRRTVDGFRVRSWLGYAEDHTLELDFGPARGGQRWVLCLDGWTDYPYPESIWAAEQARVPLVPPTLESPEGGGWRVWGELGFPAGLPRTMTRDVTGLAEAGRFRIRSNMQVYWDRIRLARRVAKEESDARARVTTLPVGRATLRKRGLARELTPDGSPPVAYAEDANEAVAISPWTGRLTRLGDVTPLLRKRDDRFVVCGPGDEVEVSFDARELPEVAAGHVRSFVLRTAGYTKDSSPFTLTGGSVGPLPYRAMPHYPPPPDAAQEGYARRWNTRRLRRLPRRRQRRHQ